MNPVTIKAISKSIINGKASGKDINQVDIENALEVLLNLAVSDVDEFKEDKEFINIYLMPPIIKELHKNLNL